jgi:PIN domain nuclease of toxin-antitoxin system
MRLGEPGGETVKAALAKAMLSAVNVAEIVSHYALSQVLVPSYCRHQR